MNLVWTPAYSHGGPFTAGYPLGVVIHSTESENLPGSAEAIAGPGWFGGPSAGTSAHKVVDQNSICEGVHRDTVAWHVGPNGNGRYIGYEFCGRASWTAAQWNAPEQLAMIRNAAPFIAADLKAIGAPARWLSLTQVAAKEKGLLTHNDVRLALGGTTHSDPGPNFPYAFLLSEVNKYMGTTTPTPVKPPVPAPAPAPKPAPAPVNNGSSLPDLAYGQTSNAVKSLQAFLNAYNWRPALPLLPLTGYYGPETTAILKAAQAQMGIVGGDGRNVGPQTKAALWARGWRG